MSRFSLIVFLAVMLFSSRARAAEPIRIFDDKTDYSIYFSRSDDISAVIRNVRIEGITLIGNKQFLVIESRQFKLDEGTGYILFDAVTAILPEDTFRVHSLASE